MLPDYPICFIPMLGGAQLDVFNHVILMDIKYENYPESVIEWLYNHERGHVLYDTPNSGRNFEIEAACDQIAYDYMRNMGYSKSMILGAMDMALENSTEKKNRIELLDRTMK